MAFEGLFPGSGADGWADAIAAIGGDATKAVRLLPVASAIVRRYLATDSPAELPPPVIESEAVLRVAGWLRDRDSGVTASEQADGLAIVGRSPGSVIVQSGAGSIMKPWKRRGAGRIEEAE